MERIRIMGGYQNTKTNNEDIALTPYFFGVKSKAIKLKNNKKTQVIGIGICWLYFAIYIGIGFNIPKQIPSFKKQNFTD